jgi:FMN-dependent oxidoreductase (nitrilotriacetate monooxygenase family)
VVNEIARIAERGLFDLLFLGDGLSAQRNSHPSFTVRMDPLVMLSALAATTSHVGLGGTASTTYGQPYSVARSFASLDHLSGGRAAWNAVTTSGSAAGGNFGRDHPDHASRYAMAGEFIDVVKGLWDCWDDDAVVADRESGVFVDWDRVRELNHVGKYFSVKGPLNSGRSPQGQPIILQAGGSEPGQALAARTADVVFTVVQDFDEARHNYRVLKEKVAAVGRDPGDVCIMPGVMPIIGESDAAARELLGVLQSYVDDTSGIGMLSSRLGCDLSGMALDQPLPDFALPDTSHGFAKAMLGKARRDRMTLRDLYNLTVAARGHWVLCGSVTTIADTMEQWFCGGAADGFNVMPAWFPGAFDDFVDLVVPELQRRGLYRRGYRGTMLRDHLGLTRPERRGAQ